MKGVVAIFILGAAIGGTFNQCQKRIVMVILNGIVKRRSTGIGIGNIDFSTMVDKVGTIEPLHLAR